MFHRVVNLQQEMNETGMLIMRFQRSALLIAVVGLLLTGAVAKANYTLTPNVGGLSSIAVTPGSTFGLDVSLTSPGSDACWASIFTIDFSQPGLKYLSHAWSSPFQTSSGDNQSDPNNSATPMTLVAGSYVAKSGDPGTVDAYFENFLQTGQFTTGKLLKLNLEVPTGFASGALTIRSMPISFTGGSDITTAGGSFTLNVQTGPTARTWTGQGSDSYLSNWANWLNGAPGVNDTIIFGAGPTQKNPTNGGTTPLTDVRGITFDATGYVFDSTTKLTVNDAIKNNATTAVINAPIELAGSARIAVPAAGNTTTINGQVTGTVGLLKGGPGKAVLTQDAAYTGNTVVTVGVLEMQGLSNSGTTTVGDGTATAALFANYIRQTSLTIHDKGKVTITGGGTSAGTSVIGSLAIALPGNSVGSISNDVEAVPEPGTLVLLGLAGSMGMLGRSARGRRSSPASDSSVRRCLLCIFEKPVQLAAIRRKEGSQQCF